MRDELNLMELVDRYLRDDLDAAGREAFEQRMRSNAEMRDLVQDQRALIIGMERLGARMAVEKAYSSYRFGKWAPGIGGAGIVLLIVAGGWLFSNKNSEHNVGHTNTDHGRPQIETVLPAAPPVDEEGTAPSDGSILGTMALPGTDEHPEASTLFFAEPELRELKDSIPVTSVQTVPVAAAPNLFRNDEQLELLSAYTAGNTAPEYPGGEIEMRKFIYANLKIPEEARRDGVYEQITVRFVIDTVGNVTAVEAVPGAGPAYEQEAERVIRAMPQWKPGSRDGKPTETQLAMPIIFMSQMQQMR